MPDTGPLALFRQLESASQGSAVLGEKQLIVETWRGVVFTVDELNMVVPFIWLQEISPVTPIWPLPAVPSWMRGMTHIGDDVYTVVDFADFIGRTPVNVTEHSKLLVLPDHRLKCALLLDGKLSMRRFNHNIPKGNLNEVEPELRCYLSFVLLEDDRLWYVVDVESLGQSDTFVNIGGSLLHEI